MGVPNFNRPLSCRLAASFKSECPQWPLTSRLRPGARVPSRATLALATVTGTQAEACGWQPGPVRLHGIFRKTPRFRYT